MVVGDHEVAKESGSVQMKRVAIVGSRGFPSTYGGYETMVRYLARDWVKRGLDVTVYCRERSGNQRSWEQEGVHCRWTPGLNTTALSTLSFGFTSHLDASRQGFDAVLVLNIANGYFLPLLRRRSVAVALNTDGVEWERGKWGKLARHVFRRGAEASARHADVLVADSEAIGAIWRKAFEVDSVFVPYGAPVLEPSSADRVRGLGLEPDSYILVVARLVPENNVELILDAAANLDGQQLVVVGSGDGGSSLERRLADLDHRSVHWLGHISDQHLLSDLWCHCGLYIHGHSVGGTNPALLQALGAGAPTLALDTPFNREVLDADDQLFPFDADALSERIAGAMSDPSLRKVWSRSGQETIHSRYSWEDVSDRYLCALELAIQRRTGRK